MKGKFFIVLLY